MLSNVFCLAFVRRTARKIDYLIWFCFCCNTSNRSSKTYWRDGREIEKAIGKQRSLFPHSATTWQSQFAFWLTLLACMCLFVSTAALRQFLVKPSFYFEHCFTFPISLFLCGNNLFYYNSRIFSISIAIMFNCSVGTSGVTHTFSAFTTTFECPQIEQKIALLESFAPI